MRVVDDFIEVSGIPCPRRTYFDSKGRERIIEYMIGGGFYQTVIKPEGEEPDFEFLAFLLRSY